MVAVTGICPVIETPFTVDGAIDVRSFERLVDRLLAAGIRAVMFPGFASEFYKLTDAERQTLMAALLARVHRVPGAIAVVSVPDHATRVAVEWATDAVRLGADMINILPPHLHGPSGADVRHHVRAILDTISPVPGILQYAPAQTGQALSPAQIAEMASENSNLVQVKVESAPPGQLISALRAAAPGLSALVGYAGVQMIDGLRRGAVGVQPGCSFVEVYLEIQRLWDDGDQDAACALHARLLPYISYWMQSIELIIAAEKRISFLRGLIDTEICRAPARALDDEERTMIDRFLIEFEDLLA